MAISNTDGSIILKTQIDQTGLKSGLKTMTSTASKAFLAISAAAGATAIAITKSAVSAFAEYEQLAGGIETLFKESSKKVMQYAEQAYKTAGLSKNEYMQSVTAFSASLLNSLGGDTEKAAEVANAALISIADNVNKMGSSYDSVQLAFQGFAKQQYMLLDNLKLGYGGTKTEMERLLRDAEAFSGVKYDINNLADVYTAIGVIQEKLGITGTTAKEAAKTISGSTAAMKASWKNLLVALAGGGDIETAVDNLLDSIETMLDNVIPVAETAMVGLGKAIENRAPDIVKRIAKAIIDEVPYLIYAVYQMAEASIKGIIAAFADMFSTEATSAVEQQISKVKETAEAQKVVREEIKKTADEQKKTLAGFDTIQKLTAETADNLAEEQQITSSTGGGLNVSGEQGTQEREDIPNKVWETLADISMIAGRMMLAIGVLLVVTGVAVPLGLGLIVAGLASEATAVGLNWKYAEEETGNALAGLLATANKYMLVIGILCLLTGPLLAPIGLALIAAHIGITAADPDWNWVATKVQETFGAVEKYWNDTIKPTLDEWGQKFDGFYAEYIEPVVNKKIIPAIDELKASVRELWTTVVSPVLSFIGEKATLLWNKYLQPFISWVSDTFGKTFETVFGIISDIAGVFFYNLGIDVSTIITSLSGLTRFLTAVFQGDWEGAWQAIEETAATVWNNTEEKGKKIVDTVLEYIEKVDWEKAWDFAKTGFKLVMNGIISLFESLLNRFIDKLNELIPTENSLVGGLLGKFGVDVSSVKLEHIKIPRLAQGAVLPGGKPYLAWVNDQPAGQTNIETQLTTMIEAFTAALDSRGGTDITVNLTGTESQFLRYLSPKIEVNNKYRGKNLLTGRQV